MSFISPRFRDMNNEWKQKGIVVKNNNNLNIA